MVSISISDIPQANQLSAVVDLVKAVAEGKTSDTDLARGESSRDGRYYRKAAENLGLIGNEKNLAYLTKTGKELLTSQDQKKFLTTVLTRNIFFQEFIIHLSQEEGFTKEEAVRLITSMISEKQSEETVQRRFSTVKSWLLELGLLKEKDNRFFLEPITVSADVLQENEELYAEESNVTLPVELPSGELPKPNRSMRAQSIMWRRNPRRARIALEKANYHCEIDSNHRTFAHQKTGKSYMEPHHLIPMEFQNRFEVNIDVPENIISLCPTCHRRVHHANSSERKNAIINLLNSRKELLPERGIFISEKQLLEMYAIE